MRQFQQRAELQFVIRLLRVRVLGFVGQQIVPREEFVAAHLRVPVDAKRLRAEGFGAVEGDEVRREEFGRGLLRDAIPVLLAREGQITRRVHHGDEDGRVGLHAVILIANARGVKWEQKKMAAAYHPDLLRDAVLGGVIVLGNSISQLQVRGVSRMAHQCKSRRDNH